jgi:riboflavin synthase
LTNYSEEVLFTGLVEEVGTIESIQVSGSGRDFMIRGGLVSSDAEVGDSIAINGCCLTVTAISDAILTFQAGSETLSRTNLGLLNPGDSVNLERSLRVGDRMGGHYVTGHIDGLATVDVRVDDGEWSEFWFSLPRELTRQLASKGSVAVDGISLTLVNVELDRFSVALIPHTLQVTTLGQRKVGDQVNIETDLLAKYVQQQLIRLELDTSS